MNRDAPNPDASGAFPRPEPTGSPVLESVLPVIAGTRHVRTDVEKIAEHAGWMAYEALPVPDFTLPFDLGGDPDSKIDFILVSTAINFAFTDFETREVFAVEYRGERWSDALALLACIARALEEGIPFLDGAWLSGVSAEDIRHVFRAEVQLPMLEERSGILRRVGTTLEERYGRRFHEFIRRAPSRLYGEGAGTRGAEDHEPDGPGSAGGRDGLIDRLVAEFPRFDDVAEHDGHRVRFYKLAQLGVWMLHGALSREEFHLEDPERLTAFADYILPVALEVMGILRYEPELERTIGEGGLIPAGSREEVEIRAHTVYAVQLLTEEVNRLRPPERRVIVPQIDYRLWSHYHETFRPHHLTRTVMY